MFLFVDITINSLVIFCASLVVAKTELVDVSRKVSVLSCSLYRDNFPPSRMIFSRSFWAWCLDGKDREWSINNINKVVATVVIINMSRTFF